MDEWLYRLDQSAFHAINVEHRHPWLGFLFMVLSYSGTAGYPIAATLLLLFWKRTRYYVLPLLVTMLFSGLIVAQGVKHLLVSRERPSNLAIAIREERWTVGSFPSGHTTLCMAVAAMLMLITWRSRNAWIGYVAVVWAVLVGVSRVYRGVHWPTDVLAGACAGLFSACVVYLVLRKLGHELHLDRPDASLSGAEVARDPEL